MALYMAESRYIQGATTYGQTLNETQITSAFEIKKYVHCGFDMHGRRGRIDCASLQMAKAISGRV